jgi:hypothetical protein
MEFVEFLLNAKNSTYANPELAITRQLEDGTKELIFETASFKYRDRYFGFNPFLGEEVVWEDGKPVWAMNYAGLVTDPASSGDEVYKFLQKAMRQVGPDRPFRGPDHYQEGDFEYFDQSEGDLNFFTGIEKIYFRGQEVYRLYYHGGNIREKSL